MKTLLLLLTLSYLSYALSLSPEEDKLVKNITDTLNSHLV